MTVRAKCVVSPRLDHTKVIFFGSFFFSSVYMSYGFLTAHVLRAKALHECVHRVKDVMRGDVREVANNVIRYKRADLKVGRVPLVRARKNRTKARPRQIDL